MKSEKKTESKSEFFQFFFVLIAIFKKWSIVTKINIIFGKNMFQNHGV